MNLDSANDKAKEIGAIGYVVEMYPNPHDGIFAYQYIGNTGRNIATYILDIAGFVPQNEYDPTGREYPAAKSMRLWRI